MSCRTVFYLIRHQSCLCGTVQRKFSVTTSVSTNKLQMKLLSEAKITDGKVEKKFKVRQNKKQKPVIPVYKNMSVEAIATASNRDIDKVLDALDLSTKTYYNKNSKGIADLKTIENAIKILGYRMKVVPNPNTQIDRQENWQDTIRQPPPDPAELVKRPPVVTIMGHVDHGKTTLLDALRKSNIVAKEFGGITQHIGAFSVNLPSGDTITFLDTPGHAAFSAMRARGASVTDIVILVVAADDGIMPQTVESIQHAANSNVPVIVAINKVDKPEADIENTEEMLLQYDLVSERLGGDVQCIPISALKGTNLQQLQDAVITLAEVMDLKGDLKGMVEGRVIDCKTLPGRGKVASIIIQRGTLKKGDMLIAGTGYAKVRSIINEKGLQLKKATLSMPVEVTGWRELPSAGDEILQCKSEKVLKVELDRRNAEISAQKVEKDSYVIEEKREKHNSEHQKELAVRYAKGLKTYIREKYSSYEKKKEEEIHHEGPSLAIILKGDVDGSVDAIMNTLNSYKSQMCRLSIISHGVGEVSLNDIETAKLFNGEIFTFNLPVSNTIIDLATLNNIVIHQDNVIYRLFENLISSLTKQLPKLQEEEILGEANIIDIFYVSVKKKKVAVAGCRCTSGSLQKKHMMRLIRNDEEIYRGSVTSLKHFKNEVHSIQKGTDCGLSLSDMSVEFQRGDVIQCYRMMDVQQTLDWTPQF